ncbi:MAG: NAD(P)/FAD-dependent oxidoreductase [Chthoniobacterales bacterium]
MSLQQRSIAIIGTGISGLASAYFLARNKNYNVTLFEKENRIGGHAHTVMVNEEEKKIPVDTGFMVYNEVTYPLLKRLFQELGVATKPTTMSFSVQHRGDDLEYNGASFNLLFAQRRNLVRFRYWQMLGQIARFHKESIEELHNPHFGEMPLRDYVVARGYGEDFLQWYLSPMAAAVWSSPPECIEEFPARTLLRFWHNHGFMGRHTHHPWRTVTGGSRAYVEKLSAPFQKNICQGASIRNITTVAQGVQINFQDGTCAFFDAVVFAVHGDQTLPLLTTPTPLEQELLSSFHYQNNEVYLHTDPQFMPKRRRAWASWNYRIDCNDKGEKHYSTHYWMNELQGVSEKQDYFVSVNPPMIPEEKHLKRHLLYEHPLFDVKAIAAQERLPELHAAGQETRRYFCGAWQRYGFHEDGLLSAVRVCQEILGHDPWK